MQRLIRRRGQLPKRHARGTTAASGVRLRTGIMPRSCPARRTKTAFPAIGPARIPASAAATVGRWATARSERRWAERVRFLPGRKGFQADSAWVNSELQGSRSHDAGRSRLIAPIPFAVRSLKKYIPAIPSLGPARKKRRGVSPDSPRSRGAWKLGAFAHAGPTPWPALEREPTGAHCPQQHARHN